MVQRIEIYSFEYNKNVNKLFVVFYMHQCCAFGDGISKKESCSDIDGIATYSIVCTIEQCSHINNFQRSAWCFSGVFLYLSMSRLRDSKFHRIMTSFVCLNFS